MEQMWSLEIFPIVWVVMSHLRRISTTCIADVLAPFGAHDFPTEWGTPQIVENGLDAEMLDTGKPQQ